MNKTLSLMDLDSWNRFKLAFVWTEPYYHFLLLSIQKFITAFYISRMDEAFQTEILSKIDSERFQSYLQVSSGGTSVLW